MSHVEHTSVGKISELAGICDPWPPLTTSVNFVNNQFPRLLLSYVEDRCHQRSEILICIIYHLKRKRAYFTENCLLTIFHTKSQLRQNVSSEGKDVTSNKCQLIQHHLELGARKSPWREKERQLFRFMTDCTKELTQIPR